MRSDKPAATAAVALRGLAFGAAVLIPAIAAHAGGYDTGERDWDFLFQQDAVAFEGATRYIDPQRTLKNVMPAPGSILFGSTASVREAAPFSVERASLAVRLGDTTRCMGSYRQPWEGRADYGSAWIGAPAATAQNFTSNDLGVTCAHATPFGIGNLLFIGGASYQDINYELMQNVFGTPATTRVSDSGVGWRGGIGYEIPQYALRATLIYNSAIGYDMTGTFTMGGPPTPIYGAITMPQSIELKAQSGVAPGWLAFGAIKWTDWSVAQSMPLCVVGTSCVQVSGLTLLWKDSWTITLGAAHQFNDALSVASSLTWDQGATQGFTSQTDTVTANLTAILTPHKNMELKFGGTIGILTAGSLDTGLGGTNPFGYTASFGNDIVYALSASAAVHY